MKRRSLKTVLSCVLVAAMTLSSGNLSVMAQNDQEAAAEEMAVQNPEPDLDYNELMSDQDNTDEAEESNVQDNTDEEEQPEEQDVSDGQDASENSDSEEVTSEIIEEAEEDLLRTEGESSEERIDLSELAKSIKDTFAGFDGGDGSEASPYRVSTVEQLAMAISYNQSQNHFILTSDMDLEGYLWYRSDGEVYFDGGNHTISNVRPGSISYMFNVENGYVRNLKIKNISDELVFATNNKGTISNVVIENVFTEKENRSGSYCAFANVNIGVIENCKIAGTITTSCSNFVGFVSQNNEDGVIDNCVNEAALISVSGATSSSRYCSGIVSSNMGMVSGCEMNASFEVSGNSKYFAGIASSNANGAIVEDCSTSKDAVFSSYETAGIVRTNYGEVNRCVNYAAIEGGSKAAGIMVEGGASSGEEKQCVDSCGNYGDVHGGSGGAAGIVCKLNSAKDFTISNCINSGDIVADSGKAAGIIAQGSLVIDNCVNEGDVTGTVCGGILAEASSPFTVGVSNCTNFGSITGKITTGGIVGSASSGPNYIIKSANFGTIESTGSSGKAGGLAGSFYECTISESFSVSDVKATKDAGGLVGSTGGNISVTDCFAATTMEIRNPQGNKGYAGGLFGYYHNDISGSDDVQKIEHCYSYCKAIVNASYGSFAGYVNKYSDEFGISDCYVLDDANPMFGNREGTGGITALKDINMRLQASFTGFDFDNVWQMGATEYRYPVLQWHPEIDKETGDVQIIRPDVWGFDNEIDFFGKESNGYMISEEDYKRLLVESSQTDAEWITGHGAGTKGKGLFEIREVWNGSCEGMSRTVALINDGTYTIQGFGLDKIPDVTSLYSVTAADQDYVNTKDDGVGIPESVISFYQLQQHIPQIQAEYTRLKNNKDEQYNAVVDLGNDLKDNPGKMGIVSFTHKKKLNGSGGDTAHTMTAYGYVDLASAVQPNFYGKNSKYLHGSDDYSIYNHCILIYDPRNKHLLDDGVDSPVNLLYDDSGNWIIPAYISSQDVNGDGQGVELKIATADPNYINTVNYADGTYAFLEYDPVNVNFADTAQLHRFSVNLEKWCESHQGILSGDIEGYTPIIANCDETDDASEHITIALPDSSKYYIQSGEDGLDARIYMGDYLVAVSSDVAGDATVETSGAGSITLQKSGNATIGLTANDGHRALDEPTVYVTAAGVKELSARQVDNGVQIEGDNLSDLSIVATDIFDDGKEISIDTEAHAVQVTKNGDNIEAFSDENGDGVFETKCGEGSIHITELALTEDELLLTPDESHTLVPVTSVEGNKDVEFTWTSEEPEVATVDENGVIKAVSMGTTSITVKAGEFTASCLVDVEKPISRNGETGIPDGMWVSSRNLEDLTYSGTAIKPEVRVYDSRTLLRKSIDYTVSYKNNTKAYELAETDAGFAASKAPCITITGKGNYGSKETVYFKIQKQSIAGEEFAAYGMSLASTGKSQKVSTALYLNGKALKSGIDYKIDVFKKEDAERKTSLGSSVKDSGEYVVRLTGAGNFKDTREVGLLVSAELKPVSKLSVGKVAGVQYTGEAITPEPAIKDGKTLLEKDKNYTFSYESNSAVGTAAVIITGIPKGGYSGTKRVTFKITGTPISKAVVEGIPKTAIYSGNEISFDENIALYIKAGKNTSRVDLEKEDYKITYENNVNAGKATVIIQGKRGYTGTVKKTFKIAPYSISPASDTTDRFKVSCPDSEYCKGGAKPKVTVQFKKADGSFAELKEGVDFKVTYKNNTSVGGSKTPTATVTGKGNFTGSEISEFTIKQKDLLKVTVNAADKAYKEKANIYATTVTLVDTDGKKLKAGTDYDKKLEYTYKFDTTVKYDGQDKTRKAGEVVDSRDIIPSNTVITVTATAREGSNYKGKGSGDFRITRASIASASVKGIGAQIYTGKEITFDPANITVKVKSDILKPYDEKTGEGDFIIKGYKNNINKGTANVTIEGVGDYYGTKTVSFKIKAKGFFWWWRM